jgi:hypothetical protein
MHPTITSTLIYTFTRRDLRHGMGVSPSFYTSLLGWLEGLLLNVLVRALSDTGFECELATLHVVRSLASRLGSFGFNPEWLHVKAEKEQVAIQCVVCVFVPFSLANPFHNHALPIYQRLLSCAMTLDKQHIITLSVFKFGAPSLIRHLVRNWGGYVHEKQKSIKCN